MSESQWLPIETAPKDGTPIVGSELYRWLPYKPAGKRQMKADGRWQRWNGFGWSNSEPPHGWQVASDRYVADITKGEASE